VPFGTGPDISRQIDGGGLDASAKHPNDRDSYGTGPDSRPSVGGTGSGTSAEHPNDRDSYGTGPDSRPSVGGTGSGTSAEHPNDRDSYGTGPDSRQLPPYLTFNPELFEHLRKFFALIPRLYRSGSISAAANIVPENDPAAATKGDPPVGTDKTAVLKGDPPVLGRYLEESGFLEELEEIRKNTASEKAFRKRFFGKFNMFWILKYLHFAEEHGVEKVEVTAAADMMLEMWGKSSLNKEKGSPISDIGYPTIGAGSPPGEGQSLTSSLESPSRKGGSRTRNEVPSTREEGFPTRELLVLYRKYFG